MVDAGSFYVLTLNGVPYNIDKGADTFADMIGILGFKNCAGVALTQGVALATCAELTAALAGVIRAGDAAGGGLNGTYPNTGLIPAAVATALGFTDCNAAPVGVGSVLATCANLSAAIAALPGEKFLQGLQSYNPATNVMTLLLNDGSTVPVDMTAQVGDAVATAIAAASVELLDAFGVHLGYIFP